MPYLTSLPGYGARLEGLTWSHCEENLATGSYHLLYPARLVAFNFFGAKLHGEHIQATTTVVSNCAPTSMGLQFAKLATI